MIFQNKDISSAFLQKLNVDDFVDAIDNLLGVNIGFVRVIGEVSSLTYASSGHCYFSLKGSKNIIRCVMFKQNVAGALLKPTEGIKVEVEAFIGVYKPRGDLQLQVRQIHAISEGVLYQSFLQLKEKLFKEGLFDDSRKKPLPKFPKTIGIVTSSSSAAYQDVKKIISQLSPHIKVILYPALVQGGSAVDSIIGALEKLQQHNEVHIVLIVRGGGSLEDLWYFNDETLIRYIANFSIPIVSGIGHETDITLVDYVADYRAPTPTAAAHLLDKTADMLLALDGMQEYLFTLVEKKINVQQQKIDYCTFFLKAIREKISGRQIQQLKTRMLNACHILHNNQKQFQSEIRRQLFNVLSNSLKIKRMELQQLETVVNSSNPSNLQKKGYAIIFREQTGKKDQFLQSAKSLQRGDKIRARLMDGIVYSDVTATKLLD